jgi:hypothetical protein
VCALPRSLAKRAIWIATAWTQLGGGSRPELHGLRKNFGCVANQSNKRPEHEAMKRGLKQNFKESKHGDNSTSGSSSGFDDHASSKESLDYRTLYN